MAEPIVFPIQIDDSQVNEAFNNLLQQVGQGVTGVEDLEDKFVQAFKDVGTEIDKTDDELKEYVRSVVKAGEESEETAKQSRTFSGVLSGLANTLERMIPGLGKFTASLKAQAGLLKGVTAGTTGATKAFKLFRVALAATGIGAIVVALGSLTALLTKTQSGIDFVNRVTAAASATFSVFVDRAASLGSAIVKLFQRDFKGAAAEAKAAFSGLTAEIAAESAAAFALEQETQNLRDAQAELNVELAEGRAKIDELRLASEDRSRGAAARSRDLQQAIEIENDLAGKRLELAERELENIRAKNALGNSLFEDVEKERQLEVQLAGIRQEAASRQRRDAARLQAIQREELARVQALRDAYNALLEDLEGRLTAARLSQLTGTDRLQAERELAIAEIERFRDEVTAAATTAGQAVPEGFTEQINQLYGAVEAEFKRQVDELRSKADTGELDPIKAIFDRETDYEKLGQEAVENVVRGAESQLPLFDRLKDQLQVALGLNDEQLAFIGDQTEAAFGNILDGINLATEAQIQQQDTLIDAIRGRVDEVETALERERRLQEQGYANDVAKLEEKLQQENESLANAENERLELERKAARQRLIQNSLEQASNIVLAVAKLTAAESGKGLIGIFTALAGLALIFRLVAQARTQAVELSRPPQFGTGGEVVGPGHPYGGVLVEAEGGEYIVRRDKATRNKTFLERLNAGAFDGMDLLGVLGARGTADMTPQAYSDAAMQASTEMINYWKTRPVEYLGNDGEKVIEWVDGGTVRRQRINDKNNSDEVSKANI